MHLPTEQELRERYLGSRSQDLRDAIKDEKNAKLFWKICEQVYDHAVRIRDTLPRMDDPSKVHPAIPRLLCPLDGVVVVASFGFSIGWPEQEQPSGVTLLARELSESEQTAIDNAPDGKIVRYGTPIGASSKATMQTEVTDGQSETKPPIGTEEPASEAEPGSVSGPLLRPGGGAGEGGVGDAGRLPPCETGVDDPAAGERDDPPQSQGGGQSSETP